MSFRIAIPGEEGATLDIADGYGTAVQRALRREGLSEYEPSTVAGLLAAFDGFPGGFTFYDVGSNVGLYAALCAQMYPTSRVIACEPTPSTARVAAEIMRRNVLDVELVDAAIGAKAGRATLYLSATSDASNSLVEGFKRQVGTIEVAVTTIDELVAEGRPAPDVLKIDVETFEPDVLRGALATIRETRPIIVVEVLRRRGHDHGPDIEEVIGDLGYHYYRLGPVPGWVSRPHIVGKRQTVHRDWLLLPDEIDDEFIRRFKRRRREIAACTADLNEDVSLPRTIASLARTHRLGSLRIIRGLIAGRARKTVKRLRRR